MKRLIEKTIILLLAIFSITGLYAQTTTIYGMVTKSDGSRIKGTSVMRFYEDQLIISNIAGGMDNTAIIEIEVPTSGYMATFRGMMSTASTNIAPITKPIASTAIKSATIATAPETKINIQSLQTSPIARIVISVTSRTGNQVPVVMRQIILEEVKVENCTDDFANGKSKIKFKASRIGWITNNWGADGKLRNTDKSGWDVVKGAAWSNF